jgi:hypothetical protein
MDFNRIIVIMIVFIFPQIIVIGIVLQLKKPNYYKPLLTSQKCIIHYKILKHVTKLILFYRRVHYNSLEI